ncbi:MAG: carboxypeptidase-like regulatory domain-containing protein [Dysgonamonadaceae bacterium]
MKLILSLIASLVLSGSAFAGNENIEKNVNASKSKTITETTVQVQVIGSVMDEVNNESLAGASILIDGVKHYSDLDGNFVVKNLAPGKHQIVVELISYETKSMDINVQKDTKINVGLVQK